MYKTCFILLVICMLLAGHILTRWTISSEEQWIKLLKDLYADCKAARERRLAWLEEHQYLPNPKSHPDYEELWLEEIGAEGLIILKMDGGAGEISYEEYLREKEELANQDSSS